MNTLLAPSRSGPQVTKLFWPLNPTGKKKHTCWWWLDKCTQSLWVINLADCNKTDSQDTLQNTASGSSETRLGKQIGTNIRMLKFEFFIEIEKEVFSTCYEHETKKNTFSFPFSHKSSYHYFQRSDVTITTSSPSLPDIILLCLVILQQLNEIVLVVVVHDICLPRNWNIRIYNTCEMATKTT